MDLVMTEKEQTFTASTVSEAMEVPEEQFFSSFASCLLIWTL